VTGFIILGGSFGDGEETLHIVPLDYVAVAAADLHQGGPACIFDSAARGLQARHAEYRDWESRHGAFGSYPRSHAWRHRL
jgi:hypothetical protein